MGQLFIQTTGLATNSGSSDTDLPKLTAANGAAVAASTVTLPAGTDLTAVDATAGSATQDTIYIADATNTNVKIFWITGKAGSGGATPTVTVSVAPTGVIANSQWSIGGRHVLTNAAIEGALRAGDTALFNDSPASANAVRWTFRNAGDSTSGFARIKGKDGTKPQLIATGTTDCVFTNALDQCSVENLEIIQQGASGLALNATGSAGLFRDLKISDAGGNGIQIGNSSNKFYNCEVTGAGATGIARSSGQTIYVIGCYIHDNVGSGFSNNIANAGGAIIGCIIESNGDRGMVFSGATTQPAGPLIIMNNTVYNNGNSGLEITDADTNVILLNNIFVNNGDAAGEYNVEWVAGAAEFNSLHGYNTFFKASLNLNGLTANATESVADPLLIDPANGDFRLGNGSPAIGNGFPGVMPGGLSIGYMDQGAIQAVRMAAGNILLGA